MTSYNKGSFGYDLEFLKIKDQPIVLGDNEAQIIVSPQFQAKVFTSTAEGLVGDSIGYIDYEAFDVEELNEHVNSYGGENRFWLGPEGGQYSVFFEKGVEQVFDNWHTPAAIDSEEWVVKSQSQTHVDMYKDIEVKNYQGTTLNIGVDRAVRLLDQKQSEQLLNVKIDNVKMVAYQTENRITNLGNEAWTKESGTICSWMLDIYPISDKAATIVPYNQGEESEMGVVATSNYFGNIPENRLQAKDGVLVFKTDGDHRGKIGLNAKRTNGLAANYSPERGILTVIKFDVDQNGEYLNSGWNPTLPPFPGDVLNGYNDGKLEDGSQIGPFCELESSSPGAFLAAGESQIHYHNVFHFVGSQEALSKISKDLLGVSLSDALEMLG